MHNLRDSVIPGDEDIDTGGSEIECFYWEMRSYLAERFTAVMIATATTATTFEYLPIELSLISSALNVEAILLQWYEWHYKGWGMSN